MGFSPQPDRWQCGPFALKHALIMLGIMADEKAISKLAGTNPLYGTNETQLRRAARKFGCDLLMERSESVDGARRALVEYLRQDIPCLVCISEWSHWVTIVKEERGRFIVLDSYDEAVLKILTFKQLAREWVYHLDEDDGTKTLYDLHPVVPLFRTQTRARVSMARARFLRRPENRDFARQWDLYVEDLLAICRPRTPLSANVLSLGEFLRRHGEMVLDQVAFWHGWIERRRAARLLANLHFVADTYGLIIHEEDEKRAIAGITSLLTLWAGGRYGVTQVYPESAKKRARRVRRSGRKA
jgi:hypothetical protein